MYKLILTGIAVGAANGLFGAGGGVISIFALQHFLHTDKKTAHATTVAVILALSIVSLFVYFNNSFVDIKTSAVASVGGVIGGIIGARLLGRLSPKYISKIFGTLMLISALERFF